VTGLWLNGEGIPAPDEGIDERGAHSGMSEARLGGGKYEREGGAGVIGSVVGGAKLTEGAEAGGAGVGGAIAGLDTKASVSNFKPEAKAALISSISPWSSPIEDSVWR
jgi:hypothetical protein